MPLPFILFLFLTSSLYISSLYSETAWNCAPISPVELFLRLVFRRISGRIFTPTLHLRSTTQRSQSRAHTLTYSLPPFKHYARRPCRPTRLLHQAPCQPPSGYASPRPTAFHPNPEQQQEQQKLCPKLRRHHPPTTTLPMVQPATLMERARAQLRALPVVAAAAAARPTRAATSAMSARATAAAYERTDATSGCPVA